MVEEKFDDICSNIRACLNSSKRQISINELNRDYQSVIGSYIPYKKYNCNSLEDFVKLVPNLKLSRIGNEWYVDVKLDERTKHIADFVRSQKASKPKKSKGRGGKFRSVYRGQPFRQTSWTGNSNRSYSSNKYNTNNNNNNNYKRYNTAPKRYTEEGPNYVTNKYRSTQPSALDFSDGEHDEYQEFGYDDSISDDENYSPGPPPKSAVEVQTPMENFKNLEITVNRSRSGRGFGSRGGLTRETLNRQKPKSNCLDDDIGYSSMCEAHPVNVDTPRERGDAKETRLFSHLKTVIHPKATPAAILAAARAAATTTTPAISAPRKMTRPRSPGYTANPPSYAANSSHGAADSIPFKQINKSSFKGGSNSSSMNNHSAMYGTPRGSTVSDNSMTAKPVASKMNELKMFTPGPENPPSYSDKTYCQKLFMFTVKHNLPCPVFSNYHKYDPTTSITLYMCRVKIGDLPAFSSMAHESSSLSEVQEYAAVQALQELKSKYENLNPGRLSTTVDKQIIISRVSEIVSQHPTGLKSEAVEKRYTSDYKEILPSEWLSIVKDLSLLSVEKLVGGIFIYPVESVQGNVNVTKLPPLILQEVDEWPIYITYCLTTNCVYFRDCQGTYDSLAERMDKLYDQKMDQLKPTDIVREGNYYAAFLGGEWYRVKTLSEGGGENVRVSLIDNGDTEEILKECVFPLDESLTDVPAQAVRCGLSNLEQYHTEPYVTEVLHDMLVGRSVVGRVDSRNPHLLLTLFDTSTEKDVNLCEAIKEKLEKELTPPKIPQKNNITDVYLTSVHEDGLAFVQIISDSFKFLRSLLASANQELTKNEKKYIVKSASQLVGGGVFLAKYEDDYAWHRAVINSLLDDKRVEVTFIDYGNVEIVPIDKIAEIQHFTSALGVIPPQAVRVQLIKPTSELFIQSVIEFLMSIAQTSDNEDTMYRLFLMKVIKDDPIPDVELFARVPDSNTIVALNNIIGSYFPNYRGANFQGVRLSLEVNKLPRIKPFVIPEGCEQIYLYVAMVFNPAHFIVQPWQYRKDYLQLIDDMKNYYRCEKPEVEISTIRIGEFFAVDRGDGEWCRGVVTLVMEDLNTVSIKCIDIGDSLSMNYQSLFVLLPCFRSMPALAIKAELAGVVPVHRDWNMQDCIRFKDLVNHKTFTGVPVDMVEDNVSLILFDMTNGVQADIGAILVEEGRATDITLES